MTADRYETADPIDAFAEPVEPIAASTDTEDTKPRWTTQVFFVHLVGSILAINFFPLGLERLNLRPIDVVGAGCWIMFLTFPADRSRSSPRLWRHATVITGTVLLVYLVNGVIWYDDALLVELGQRCLRLFLMLGPLAAASKVTLTPRQADRLLHLMTASAVIGVYLSVVAYRAGVRLVFAHQTLADGNRRVPRLGGLVGETGAFSLYFFAAAMFVIFVGVRRKQLTLALAVALPMWALAFDGTAARISLPMIVPLCVLAGLHAMRGKRSKALLPCLAAIPLVLVFYAFDVVTESPAVDRILDAVQSGASVTSGRYENWSELMAEFQQNPVIGRGYRSSEFTVGPSENFVVQGLVEFGLLGSSILVLTVGRIAKASVRAVGERSTAEALVLKGVLWGVLVQWLVNDVSTYYQAFSLIVLFLVVVPRLSPADPRRRKQAASKRATNRGPVIDLRNIEPRLAKERV